MVSPVPTPPCFLLANRGDRTQYSQPRFALVPPGGYRDVGRRSRTPTRARGREPARAFPHRLRCPSQLARSAGRAALPPPVLGGLRRREPVQIAAQLTLSQRCR